MFTSAFLKASQFTRPVITAMASAGGKTAAGVGSFVIINEEGYFVTALHILKQWTEMIGQRNSNRKLTEQAAAIEADTALSNNERRKRLLKLGKMPATAARDCAIMWGWPDAKVEQTWGLEAMDLAVGKLTNFDSSRVKTYPVFSKATGVAHNGKSLCKLGFPFPSIEPVYDPVKQKFDLPAGTQLPLFPIDGILTRIVNVDPGQQGDRAFPLRFIETSTPGLRGQSGGPTFDSEGNIWAIQSRTMHLPLGFDPEVKDGNGRTTHKEHQFLNVGWGVHCETVAGFLKELKIKFYSEE